MDLLVRTFGDLCEQMLELPHHFLDARGRKQIGVVNKRKLNLFLAHARVQSQIKF